MKYKAISIFVALFTFLAPVSVFSQEAGGGIDQKVGEIFNTVLGRLFHLFFIPCRSTVSAFH
jgi:hypothetical protein